MAVWRFVYADQNFIPVGEITNASGRKVTVSNSKVESSSLSVRLDNPLADYLGSTEGYIKAYRNNVLYSYNEIITAEEVGDSGTPHLAINCLSPAWRLQKRLAGKSTTGTSFTNQDRATIFATLLDTTNAEDDTHLSTAAFPISAASAVTYTAGPYVKLSSVLDELSTGLDAFDWRFVPLENYDYSTASVTSQKIAGFWAAPLIGQDSPAAVFEYGTGTRNNIATYTRRVARDTQINKAWHATSGGPSTFISTADTPSQIKWGWMEETVEADLTNATFRTQLIQQHVDVRKDPRVILTWNPHVDPNGIRMPVYGAEYTVGDSVIGRGITQGRVRFNGWFRVWQTTFDIGDDGMERTQLVVEEGDAQ